MKPSPPSAPPEQEFPYGWRYVKRVGADGSEDFDRVPLTLEDVLHPQEGDVIPESTDHDAICTYLAITFRDRQLAPGLAFAFVAHDLLVNWGVAGIRNHSPDLALFAGLSRDPTPTGLLDLQAFNGRCELALEVVSPHTRNNDVVEKFAHYHAIGIPLYVIIDQHREGGPRTVRAYRLTAAGYVEVAPDPQGRVALPPLGLLLGIRDDRAVCFDAATGEEVEGFSEQVRGREEVTEQFRLFKEESEQSHAEQVQARQTAEREADKQRQEAEKQRQEADKQRQEAEDQRRALELLQQQKRAAEEQAAKTIRELQEKLRLLQGGGGAAATPADPGP
jgi:Uma2 family endonuclease